MTTALADLLAARLRPLPFLERVVGLARPVDRTIVEGIGDNATTRRTKTPEALAFPPATPACVQDEHYLLPDKTTASIFFFEDLGTVDYQLPGGGSIYGKESTLRLLGWINPKCFAEPLDENVLVDALLAALLVRVRQDAPPYYGLTVTATVLPAEAALFSKYTYGADQNPMLYPPYLTLGLELKCRYLYRPECPAPALPTYQGYKAC